MPNRSKVNDPRWWARWRAAGSVDKPFRVTAARFTVLVDGRPLGTVTGFTFAAKARVDDLGGGQ